MKRFISLLLALIMFSSLMVSGCTNQDDSEVDNESASEDSAEDILAQEGAALTDEEISSLDDDLAELESMLEGVDNDSNITVEDI
jgi:outer membrane murein-binding lipoprotein Lpp